MVDREEMVVARFAPSPTGWLHLGHALAAYVAWKVARDAGGKFLLRHEDIDATRVREVYYRAIEDDLLWLGLEWDGVALRQTDRREAHDAALRTLDEMGVVYPCFCTRKEIQAEWARMAGAPHAGEGELLYPGTCRAIEMSERTGLLAAGVPHAWRLDATKAADAVGALQFTDQRFGIVNVDPLKLGDVILARKDIGPAYHLAVVVDDAFQQVTHVTRGEDLLASTHVHRVLQELLALPQPAYWHHRLVKDACGQRLAKRADGLALAILRENGEKPANLINKLESYLNSSASDAS